jgi:hypothetical protein
MQNFILAWIDLHVQMCRTLYWQPFTTKLEGLANKSPKTFLDFFCKTVSPITMHLHKFGLFLIESWRHKVLIKSMLTMQHIK